MTRQRLRHRIQATNNWTSFENDESELAGAVLPQPKFCVLRTDSPMERAAAIYALRMMEGARMAPRMIHRGDVRDADLLTLVGLELEENPDNKLKPIHLRTALSKQLQSLEARGMPKLTKLEANIARVARAVGLGKTEADVLQLAVIVAHVPRFAELFNLGPFMHQSFCSLMRHAIGHTPSRLEKAMAPVGTLRRVGLLEEGTNYNHCRHPIEVDQKMAALLSSPHFDENDVLRHLLRTPPPATLTLEDYPSTLDIQMLCRRVRKGVSERHKGVNILIHGTPGTGKTEFVRTLAKESGFVLSEVPNEDNEGDAISGRKRFRAFSMAQNLLSLRRGQLLLFDEVEDVFGRGGSMDWLFGLGSRRDPDDLAKGWINQTLENNPVPTIWVCNSIDAIDPAYLRRFDMTVEFRTPTKQVRRRIVERHFPESLLSERGKEKLAAMEELPPAQVERAARVVRALNSRDQSQRDNEAERAATLALRAMRLKTPRAHTELPPHYDPAFLNTDRDLEALARGLAVGRNARLCLYGPPGTGKTAFGHHLANVIDKPLHVKRASDLISKWVGETERNLAEAFRAASDEGAILLIDEADSFLQDRGRAQHSWEVTAVNEMLTQMESFDGLFIASTNLVDSLDAASLRRFDFKIRFDCLTREQRRSLFVRVAEPIGDSSLSDIEGHRLDCMDRLVPGDIANVLRQLRTMGEAPTSTLLLNLLDAELRLKPGASARTIGF